MPETAVIKVAEVDKREPEYIHFSDASGKKWNCNDVRFLRNAKSDDLPIFNEGRKLKVEFNVTDPKEGFKYGARYINEVSLPHESESLTWPDKEPYQGNSGGNSTANKHEFQRSKEQCMRGEAIIAAGGDIQEARILYEWIAEGDLDDKVAAMAEGLDATVISTDDDIPF